MFKFEHLNCNKVFLFYFELITEELTASLEEINASSKALAKIAENLQAQVTVFKI